MKNRENITERMQNSSLLGNRKRKFSQSVLSIKRIPNKVISNLEPKTTITLRDCISEVSKTWSSNVRNNKKKRFSKAGFKNEIIETDIEISEDVQREWELVHCDGRHFIRLLIKMIIIIIKNR